MISTIFENAKLASRELSSLNDEERKHIVEGIADALEKNISLICEENAKDANLMEDNDPKKDRLLLTPERLHGIIKACRNIASLESPIGKTLLEKKLKNKLLLKKISVPLGVVGAIYESRPNVTIDISSLCVKSGNAAILRGGKETIYSNTCLVTLMQKAIRNLGYDHNFIQLFPTDRALMKDFLSASNYIDIIIPRGSEALINYVRSESKIPTIETGAGVCHTYIHKEANIDRAIEIVDNAKHQRPSVCNALDTVLIDEAIAEEVLKKIVVPFSKYKTKIWADEKAFTILEANRYPFLKKANHESFGKEYLSYGCSIAIVSGMEKALSHIAQYSSKHSEAIVSENENVCETFLNKVDAAAVYSNASTRFTDGEIFELGAEIGISTQKLHARGPFALEKLVTEKWVIRGQGQIRD